MEHPLIGNLEELTLEDLSKTVTDLNQKLTIAMRTGNGHLCNQIRMALESYQTKYQEKVQSTYRKQIEDSNFNSKIDIK
jgi:hypothetical protein